MDKSAAKATILMSPTGKSKPGFTLIEAIVLIVIIGVISGMAIPRLSGSLATAALRSSARDLKTATQYARDFAISHQTPTRLLLNAEENLYMLQAQLTNDEGQTTFTQMTLAMTGTRKLARGVKFGTVQIQPGLSSTASSESSDSSTQINFDPLGQADAASIQITNDRHFWTLYIAPSSGRVTLTEGDQPPPPQDREDLDV